MNLEPNGECSFCAPSAEQLQEAIRNQLVRVLYPLAPLIRPYAFVIPARHVERFSDLRTEEFLAISAAAQAVSRGFADLYGATGLNLFTNDGRSAGQSAPHVHFHLFGRYEGEPANPFQVLNDPSLHPGRLSEAELRARADELGEATRPYWNTDFREAP